MDKNFNLRDSLDSLKKIFPNNSTSSISSSNLLEHFTPSFQLLQNDESLSSIKSSDDVRKALKIFAVSPYSLISYFPIW